MGKTKNPHNILSDEERSLLASVLDIIIHLHNPENYEQLVLSIQETIDDKLDKHLVGGE
jgi:hypothetical protein